jgi:DNA-binding transcriptional MerR regulator
VTDRDRADELLPIGRFARACRLGIKALRHYDELGLLRPVRVDASGYRYYARSQARAAIAIALLRSLDVPLVAIRDILRAGDPGAVAAALAGERARIERQLARATEALFCVERIIRDGALMPYAVTVRDEPARALVAVEATTTPERHVAVGYELFGRLRAVLGRLGLPVVAPVVCVLPEPPDDDAMVLQMCSGLAGAAADAEDADERIRRAGARRIQLPAGPFAFVTHRGPYEELGLAQHAVAAWIQERGRAAAGPMREIYRNDPSLVDRADVLTEVGVPLVA